MAERFNPDPKIIETNNTDLVAMIFAAGMGTRFKPWTDKHPKALAVINGKSLLQRNVEYLQQYGIRRLVVNVHHFPEQVIGAIETNKGWGSLIHLSDESGELLETGGGLKKSIEPVRCKHHCAHQFRYPHRSRSWQNDKFSPHKKSPRHAGRNGQGNLALFSFQQ